MKEAFCWCLIFIKVARKEDIYIYKSTNLEEQNRVWKNLHNGEEQSRVAAEQAYQHQPWPHQVKEFQKLTSCSMLHHLPQISSQPTWVSSQTPSFKLMPSKRLITS
jgi:hypothetical protein